MLKYILALVLAVCAVPSVAASCQNEKQDSNGPTILFVNGIGNDYGAACDSLGWLRLVTASNGISDATTNFELFHNPTQGLFGDVNELRIQAGLSSRALRTMVGNSRESYLRKLGEIYKSFLVDGAVSKSLCKQYEEDEFDTNDPKLALLAEGLQEADRVALVENLCERIYYSTVWLAGHLQQLAGGNGVVVVAHSQGNFYIEAAYAILQAIDDPNISKIRVVGVANISRTAPTGSYFTISDDNALYKLQAANTSMLRTAGYSPLPANITACRAGYPCVKEAGGDSSPNSLGTLVGSLGVSAELLGALGLSDSFYMLHEFTNVYLNPIITNRATDKPIRDEIAASIAVQLSILVGNSEVNCGNVTSPSIDGLLGPSYTMTAGQAYTYRTTPVPKDGFPYFSYLWDFTTGESEIPLVWQSYDPSTTYTYAAAGTHVVTVTPILADGTVCKNSAATSQVTVQLGVQLPAPSYSINFDGPSLSALGMTGLGFNVFPGKDGRPAAKFSGVASPGYMKFPNSSSMQFTDGGTYDLWARIDSNVGESLSGGSTPWMMALISKAGLIPGMSLGIDQPDPNAPGSGFGFAAFFSSDASWWSGGCTTWNRNPGVAQGEWFRVTAVASRTTGTRFYANKSLVYECPNARPDFTQLNSQDLYLGLTSSGHYPLDGAIQDVRIYQQVLTVEQVQALP